MSQTQKRKIEKSQAQNRIIGIKAHNVGLSSARVARVSLSLTKYVSVRFAICERDLCNAQLPLPLLSMAGAAWQRRIFENESDDGKTLQVCDNYEELCHTYSARNEKFQFPL
jgi:hypothetical protein